MIRKNITYKNLDGEVVAKDFYFNLSKKEIIDWDREVEGGLAKTLTDIGAGNNGGEVFNAFSDIIGRAYGEREGDHLVKSKEISDRFLASQAFDYLIGELIMDPEGAARLVNGILPSDIGEISDAVAKQGLRVPPVVQGTTVQDIELPEGSNTLSSYAEIQRESGLDFPMDVDGNPLPWAYREPTHEELMNMNDVHMRAIYNRKAKGWTPKTT